VTQSRGALVVSRAAEEGSINTVAHGVLNGPRELFLSGSSPGRLERFGGCHDDATRTHHPSAQTSQMISPPKNLPTVDQDSTLQDIDAATSFALESEMLVAASPTAKRQGL
jgi:hypothetical protein